jgi:hypothetical protein
MPVSTPSGWADFEGGGSDPELCGDEDMSLDLSAELSCAGSVLETTGTVNGGVPPFTWTVSEGQLEVTSTRTMELRIDGQVDFGTLRIDYGAGEINPCSMIAYVQRGRGYLAIDCAQPQCFGNVFNCYGESVGALPGSQEIGDCHDIDADNLADPQFNYVNCGSGVSNWPILTDNYSSPFSNACGVPQGETGLFPVKIYNSFATCATAPTDATEGSTLSPNTVSYLRNHAAEISACDTRLDDLKDLGCSPCKLLVGTDIVITVTDARDVTLVREVHIS